MGEIFLYTGDGGGKTTNALGAALRCLGHGKTVKIIQFLKWMKNTGEYKFKHPNYQIIQVGSEGWKSRSELGSKDRLGVAVGLIMAKALLCSKNPPDLLVLDELNLATKLGMANVDIVLKLLTNIPEKTTIFITGREAPQELMDRADYVIEIKPVKIPKKMSNREGINY